MLSSPLSAALVLGCTALATACTGPAGASGGPPIAAAPAAVGDVPDRALVTAGRYQLQSTLEVEAATLLPAAAYDAVLTLEGLRDHPARTLFALAAAAGVPAVGTVRAALPSALASRLDGWIDGHVRTVTTGDGSLAQVVDAVVGIGRTEVAEIKLGSTLALTADGASHRLDTVALEVLDRTLDYAVAPLAGVGAELEVPVTITAVPDGAAVRLTLAGHGFGLPYGTIAWRAFDTLVTARYHRDLRAVLGAQVDCPGMAAAVATRCVVKVCVGHAGELRAICEAGLDRAVAQLRTRVEAATIEPIALDAGTAHLVDGTPADRAASTVAGGAWTARLDLGQGQRPAAATFAGARR